MHSLKMKFFSLAAAGALCVSLAGCNLSTPALQDKNVRQAMSYAMDRQAIIDVVFAGQAVPCSMMPPAMGHWALDVSGMDLYQTNVEKAKQLGNQRSSTADKAIQLTPPIVFTLEEALEYIQDDELVEVTPKSIRMRKRLLSAVDRKKQANGKL